MSRLFSNKLAILFAFVAGIPVSVVAQNVAEAMKIAPTQTGVDFETPTESDYDVLKLERAADLLDIPGWIVLDSSGRKLRQFLDTAGNRKLDTWSFYKNGIEVYRELDTDGDNKKDQMRWLGTAGTRWGVDRNQDGKIDFWKSISAEEVAEEIFESLKQKDAARFQAVMLTEEELKSLKLNAELETSVRKQLEKTRSEISNFVRSFQGISPDSTFVHFGSSTPFLLGNEFGKGGNQTDVMFYDHASAVFNDTKTFGQLAIGTLVRVGDGWRAVELPALMADGKVIANGGILLNATAGRESAVASSGTSERLTELFEKFEALEKRLADATPETADEKLEKERAQLLFQLVLASSGEENRKNWIRQLTDTVTTSFERGNYKTGLEDLQNIANDLKKEGITHDLDYIDYRSIMARFAVNADGTAEKQAAATEKLQTSLEKFIADNPKSEYAAEGLMQLALYAEVNAASEKELTKAVAFYEQVEKNFAGTKSAAKAKGARTRLTCVGKPIDFVGNTLANQKFDLSNQAVREKVVVLHYWATWCDVCVADFEELQRLSAKYKSDLVVIGVNLDESAESLKDFQSKNDNYKWPQLFAEGGISSSPLAEQLGVTTLPLTILIDKAGNVVETRIGVSELDRGIQALLDK